MSNSYKSRFAAYREEMLGKQEEEKTSSQNTSSGDSTKQYNPVYAEKFNTYRAEMQANPASSVNDFYIRDFISDAQDYVGHYSSVLSNPSWKNFNNGGTAKLNASTNDLLTRSGAIRSYLEENKELYDADTYSEIESFLNDFSYNRNKIARAYSEYQKMFSQFETEKDYDKSVRQYGYQQKYQGKGYDEIQTMLADMQDGEEKDWLSEHAVDYMTLDEAKSKRDSTSGSEQLYYTDLYNQKLIDKNVEILANTKMDGTNGSILKELEAIAQMENGPEKKQRKAAVMNKLDELGIGREDYALYAGDSNVTWDTFWKWAGKSAEAGVASFGQGISGTLDLLLGKPMQALGWENNPVSALASYTDDQYNALKYNADLLGAKMGGGTGIEYGGQFLEGLGGAIPDALLAIMTAGTSTVTNLSTKAAYESGSILTKAGLTAQTMAKNPQFWVSYARTLNSDYEEAKALGANDYVAAIGATISSLINAGIEIGFDGGSGIQGLPNDLADEGVNGILAWVESSLEEGGEELLQGFVSNAVSKVLYDSETELFNPKEMATEFAIGTAVGAVLGGAQTATMNTAKSVTDSVRTAKDNQRAKKFYGSDLENIQALVLEGLESAEGSTSRILAEQYQKKLDSGKSLTGAEISKLVEANEEAFRTESITTIQAAAEEKLTELGETGDVAEIARVIAKKASGETLTRSEVSVLQDSKYGTTVAQSIDGNNKNGRIDADEYVRMLEAAQLPQEAAETTGEQVAADLQNVAQEVQPAPVEAPAANDQQVTGKLTAEESSAVAAEQEKPVTRQNSTGKAVTPKKIASISGGKVMIETGSGTIAADDITFGTKDADLLWRGAVDFNGINAAGANGVIHAYRSGQSVATYLQGAAQEFRNGYNNMESGGEYADKLTDWQREIIYNLGQKAAGENTAKAQAKATAAKKQKATASKTSSVAYKMSPTGNVHFDRNGRTFDTKRETALKTMEQLSKALGVEFYVYESYANEAGQRVYRNANGNEVKAPNGFYDPIDGSIHIDLNAGADGKGTMIFTIAHELTHFIRQWSPAKFKVLANFLIKQYGEDDVSVNELVHAQIKKANDHGRELNWDEAYEEVVADSMEAIMTDGNVVQMMAELKQQDKRLWQKICDWFKDLVTDLKALVGAYKDVKPDSNEGKMVAQMQDVITMLEYLYADALVDAGENFQAASEVQKNTTQEGDVKYSFAGKNSENANHVTLDKAKEMHEQGMDNESIRQETGWFVGMDGKWRYEIDDSQMEITNNLSNYMRLGDMMQHDALYAAYPDLADIDVVFQSLKDGVNGSYNPQFDSINLSYKLKNDPFGLKDALIHELQHAIQHREGFTKGTTVENWERKKKQGFDSRRAEDRRKAQETESELRRLQKEEPEFYREMLELEAMTPNVPRGAVDWDTLEKIEDDPIEWQQYDARREELEAKYGDLRVWDTNDLLYQRTRAAQNAGRSGTELYFDTAGEIEARDVTNRLTKTQEQRKTIPPRLGNEDTVFAEGDNPADAYIPGDVNEAEIQSNIKTIAEMSPVTKIKADEFKMGDGRLLQDVTAFFESVGGSVYNDRLGDVYLRKRGVRHDLGHGMSDEKATSFAAIPDVLQYGKVAGFVKNKDNKGFDSATVVAPIEIGQDPYMMGVIVHRSNNENRFYVHDVFCIKEEAAPLITGTHEVGETGGTTSTISIVRRILDVKRKNANKKFSERDSSPVKANATYSERDPELEKVNRVLAKENTELKHDVAYLKELLKLQKQVTGGTKFTKTSVEASAGQLMKYANAKGDKTELAGLLNGLYEYIAKGEELTWDGVKEAAQPAVDWLQSHVNTKKQRSSYAEDVLKEIRGSRISLDELQKKEVAYQYGSVNEFRKKAMGSFTVTDQNAISLDSQWREWAGLYPNIFDSEISSNDMPGALLDAFDTLRSMTDTYDYGFDQELVGQDLLRQVYDSYWNVSTLYTVADKAQKEINKLKFEHAGRMATLKKYHKEQTANLKQEHREALQKVKQAERERSEKKLQELSDRYQESRKKNEENRHKTEMRRKIRKTIMELNKILNRGDKKRNVKEDMKDLVAQALSSADILFTDNYTVEDMVRYGVGTELTEQEAKYMEEARKILAEIDNAGTAEERIHAEERLKGKLDYRMGKLKDVFTRERAKLNKTQVSEVLGGLADAYASLENSEYSYVSGAFDENVHQYLMKLKTDVGGTIVKDMSLNQLAELHDAYTMVLTTVRNANKMFAANMKQTREQLGSQTIQEVKQAGGEHGLWLPVVDKINAFSWNNQKPVYAFERIGSATLAQLFDNVRTGEDSWAKDMTEAREFYLDKTRKYKYDSWDFDKQYPFTSTSGIDFSLNLEQIMSLYAYYKREQARDHLMKGGFVFDGNTEVQVNKMGIKVTYLNKTAKAHNVSPEIMGEIVSKLSAEQKAFVDEMQDYLSTAMGAKGNEVSMQLYGVELFKEKYYFPLRSAGQYMERAKEANLKKQQGQISIVNSGFTKNTTPKSSNPVVLSGFMDVWADHVNEMSMYHSFVLPMEDFRRVYNYSSPNMETGQSVSVNSTIQDAYGEAATQYIDQLYRDLNGGAVSDPRENGIKVLVGSFKKAAVFASLSVVIQQPSAIGRAFAIIDPKYFIGSKVDHKRHKALWAELKQYAPVAVIKEMGYFDTGMGKSAQDFIKGKEYNTIKEKAAAIFTDGNYRDELLGKAPALADELTWCAIWEAAKRETKAKNPKMGVRSEEFLQMAGKRFTEVITKTQVYDSVLSRSANMRSKGAMMSMWTAFMAEPTTTINMVESALRKGMKGDKKYAARALGAAVGSVILNSLLASLVYAMRDDDEDETFLEKYVQSFATEMLDGINPLTYYPLLKDIWSALQGFDIERSDMSLITKLTEAITKLVQVFSKDTDGMDESDLEAHRKRLADAWWGVGDYVTALAGIPVKNIRRDINGAVNTYKTIASDLTDRDTTWGSLIDKTWDDVKNTIPVVGWMPDSTAADKLYKATVSGDAAYQKRLASSYSTENSLNTAIRKGLRSNDSRIWEAAIAWNNNDLESYKRLAREIVAEGHFSQDNVVLAIQAEAKAMLPSESESTTSKAKGYFTAEKFAVAVSQGNNAMAKEIRADIIDTAQRNGKTLEEAEKNFASTAKSNMKELFLAGEISEQATVNALTTYCGMEKEDAMADVQYWEFKQNYPDVYADDAWFDKYYNEVADSGIKIDLYMDYRNQVKDVKGEDKKERRMAVIDELPITIEQKDALYYAEGWAESKINEAPWH